MFYCSELISLLEASGVDTPSSFKVLGETLATASTARVSAFSKGEQKERT
jgi:hypothetical protein